MTPYYKAMKEKTLSLGMFYSLVGPELVSALAEGSFNHLVIDHMFSRQTWQTTAEIIVAARLHGIAPFVRVQTYPWFGGADDMHVVSEVCRARKLGAAGAVVSISSASQLRACMHPAGPIEHNPWIGSPLKAAERYSRGGWDAVLATVPEEGRTFPVVAYIEDARLLDLLDDIVAVGPAAIGLGMTDLSHSLGQPYDVEHPDVRRAVDRVVEHARPRNISVWANTGWGFPRIDDIVGRIERLYAQGVDSIQVQNPNGVLGAILSEVSLRAVRTAAPA